MGAIREWWLGDDHTDIVSEAYQEMQDKMSQDDVDQTFRSNFEELQRQQASGNANALQDTNWESAEDQDSPMERWQKQIDGLINSGNPVLQKKGMDMLGVAQKEAATGGSITDSRTTNTKEYEYAVGQGYGGTLEEWMEQKAAMSKAGGP